MLYFFNKNEEYTRMIPACDIFSCIQEEELNNIITLEFELKEQIRDSEVFVLHKSKQGHYLYKIVNYQTTDNGVLYKAIHVVFDELKSYGYIKERRLTQVNVTEALDEVLKGTRWSVGKTLNKERKNIHFYYKTISECISKILEIFNVELSYNVEFVNNKIISRKINLFEQRGIERNKRYVYGDKALKVVKQEDFSEIYTSIVGRGKGEEKETGGYGRRINFTNVVWEKEKGDPVDKPLGQEFLELKNLTKVYGFADGKPRVKIWVFENVEDPKELLKRSYEKLLKISRPRVQFSADIDENDFLEIGDTVTIVRKDLDIFYKTRIFKIKRDILADRNISIELGDKVSRTQFDTIREISKQIETQKEVTAENIGGVYKKMQDFLNFNLHDDNAFWYFLEKDNEYNYPAGFYTFDKPINENPTKAIYIGAGKMALSNKKDSENNFIFETWATGDGIVATAINSGILNADLIKAGTIKGSGSSFWNLDTGEINIGDIFIYNPVDKKLIIKQGAELEDVNINTAIRNYIIGSKNTQDSYYLSKALKPIEHIIRMELNATIKQDEIEVFVR